MTQDKDVIEVEDLLKGKIVLSFQKMAEGFVIEVVKAKSFRKERISIYCGVFGIEVMRVEKSNVSQKCWSESEPEKYWERIFSHLCLGVADMQEADVPAERKLGFSCVKCGETFLISVTDFMKVSGDWDKEIMEQFRSVEGRAKLANRLRFSASCEGLKENDSTASS